MSVEWSSRLLEHAQREVEAWRRELDAMVAHQEALVRERQWFSGARDLLTIARVARRELTHSALIGWVLDPNGRHNLETFPLDAILNSGWPIAKPWSTEFARVYLEVPRKTSRADIVVECPEGVLVIENKVDSVESPGQCELLWSHWRDVSDDVRFLLVNTVGSRPQSVESDAARGAWRWMSYRAWTSLVVSLASPLRPGSVDRALGEYISTLRTAFIPSPFAVSKETQGG